MLVLHCRTIDPVRRSSRASDARWRDGGPNHGCAVDAAAGQVGDILGQGLTGTTSVFLNGTSASFTVVSDTLIRATVPPGATTGFVTVVTSSGTLRSNVPFYVIP